MTLYVFSGAFVVALVTSFAMIAYIKKARARVDAEAAVA
jgi:hypothetical protein